MCMEWLNGEIRACDVLEGTARVRQRWGKSFLQCATRDITVFFLLRGVSLITKNSIVCLSVQTQRNLNMLLPWDYLHFSLGSLVMCFSLCLLLNVCVITILFPYSSCYKFHILFLENGGKFPIFCFLLCTNTIRSMSSPFMLQYLWKAVNT